MAALATIAGVALAGVAPRTGGRHRKYYVAIGASQTLGYQPMGPGVQRPTDHGYTNDLLETERGRWRGLALAHFACPGIRVDMALFGRTTHAPGSMAATTGSGRCRRRTGSEVGSASSFIRSHPGQVVVVTVDLGYPDVTACLRQRTIHWTCVTDALRRVRAALPVVVARLRAAGGASLRIVGLDYQDPFLGYAVGTSDPDPSFAEASVGVVERLNRVLRTAYAGVHVPVAPISAAFATGVTAPAHLHRWGTVPLEVERICTLTWVCRDRNPHPDARGYRRIASVVAATLARTGR